MDAPPRLDLNPTTYQHLLKTARRHASHLVEAEDLVHETLIVALTVDKRPEVANRAWLQGVMRNVAATKRRSAVRRVIRENAADISGSGSEAVLPAEFLVNLPRSQRIVALLALGGHTRKEIRHLLRISDAGLRQRIAALRARWRNEAHESGHPGEEHLSGTLAFGAIRQNLLPLARHSGAFLASHDPDGHLFAISFSSSQPHETGFCGNRKAEPAV
ncbi:RNA polymerase sigma factor [Nitratireductor kimnyeongensis]|uniref:RNA polymerase sigma factor n=1 Tax=Nitratireductor kimnyeongensis TaxID=430679 RepID=A0ABW0T712_9HYPH|nr:sigma factor [Nitratireductor kimnyeongensis]QZZ36352.1 RNA polymerase sigma factor [Nitratireductor kimnyeongensis]